MPEGPRVEPVDGEIFRYYVHSWNSSAVYLVDLSEEDFLGTCSCPHHLCRIAPARREGKKMRCKHVKEALEYAWPHFGRAILEKAEEIRRGKT